MTWRTNWPVQLEARLSALQATLNRGQFSAIGMKTLREQMQSLIAWWVEDEAPEPTAPTRVSPSVSPTAFRPAQWQLPFTAFVCDTCYRRAVTALAAGEACPRDVIVPGILPSREDAHAPCPGHLIAVNLELDLRAARETALAEAHAELFLSVMDNIFSGSRAERIITSILRHGASATVERLQQMVAAWEPCDARGPSGAVCVFQKGHAGEVHADRTRDVTWGNP